MGSRSPPAVLFFLICLSLFASLSSSSASSRLRDGFASSSRRLAVDLIRGLNLLPGAGEVETEEEADTGGPRLVEKKLNLEILGVSGSNNSVEDLGHHAGYYRLEHTHAAR